MFSLPRVLGHRIEANRFSECFLRKAMAAQIVEHDSLKSLLFIYIVTLLSCPTCYYHML